MTKELTRKDILYPELSYKVIGCAFDVSNELGFRYHEKYYQRALVEAFKEKGLKFAEQVNFPLKYKDKIIGRNFLDFVIENKIVLELKKGSYFSRKHIEQVMEYLHLSNLKLALLVNFTDYGVTFKRIINFNS